MIKISDLNRADLNRPTLTESEVSVIIALTRTERQTRDTVKTHEVRFK